MADRYEGGSGAAKGKGAAPKPTNQGPAGVPGSVNQSRKTGSGEVGGQPGIGYRYAKGDVNQSRKVGSGDVEGAGLDKLGPQFNQRDASVTVEKQEKYKHPSDVTP